MFFVEHHRGLAATSIFPALDIDLNNTCAAAARVVQPIACTSLLAIEVSIFPRTFWRSNQNRILGNNQPILSPAPLENSLWKFLQFRLKTKNVVWGGTRAGAPLSCYPNEVYANDEQVNNRAANGGFIILECAPGKGQLERPPSAHIVRHSARFDYDYFRMTLGTDKLDPLLQNDIRGLGTRFNFLLK